MVDSLEKSQLPRRAEVEALQEEQNSAHDWDPDSYPCDGTDGDANACDDAEELYIYTRIRPVKMLETNSHHGHVHLPNSVTIKAIGSCQSHNRMSWLNLQEFNRSVDILSQWVELRPVKDSRHAY